VILAARLFIAATLCLAGVMKLRAGPAAFAQAVRGYDLLPARLVTPIATTLPPFEVALGVLLLAGAMTRPAAAAACVVLVAFALAVADIVKVDFDQAELARRYAAVAGDREIIALRGRAAQEGLHIDIASSSGARASLRQAPQLSGYVVIAPLRKADGAIAGGIIFGQSAEGQFKASLGLQRGTGAYDVYRGLGGNAQRESTISKTDRDITIDFADGTRRVIQIPARPSSGKAGLAAPLATCGMDCLQCNVVCTVAI